MLHIFNRMELMTTDDLNVQANIRTLLANHQIAYQVKTINRMSPSPLDAGTRARTGTFGINIEKIYQYIIYVNKKDYEKAKYLLREHEKMWT